MKQVKTEFCSSKLVRFSKQISNLNISAPVKDIQSKFPLRCGPESQLSLGKIPATKSRPPNRGYWKPCGYLCLKQLSNDFASLEPATQLET